MNRLRLVQKSGVSETAKITQKILTISLIVIILLAISASSVAAAPIGTKESDVVTYAKSWVGVPNRARRQ